MRERRLVGVSLASGALLLMVLTFWGPWASAQDFQGNQTTQAGGGPEFSQAPGLPEAQGTPGAAEGQQPSDPNTEVLTKGAIHEAFAQPVVFNSAPGAVVAQKPPEPVDEMPPEQKPAGDHVAWIPGYWTWEGDQNKFIWTSGIWRSIPAGVEWVPGYWQQVDTGSQFVSGYWRKTAEQEVTYMPQKPPDTLETGPVGAAPSPNVVWIPGCWVWRGSHYAWRAGFWAPCNPDWIWVPAHYVWTPSGYLFVEGHWDYAMQNRGVFFAPVVFRPGIVWVPGTSTRRPSPWISALVRAASSAARAATASATTTGRRLSASAFIPGSNGIIATVTIPASPTAAGTTEQAGVSELSSIIASASDTPRLDRPSPSR